MNVGDVLPMKSIRVALDNGWVSYKAPDGEHFLVVLLGSEPIDGSSPLDPKDVFNALGWVESEANELSALEGEGQ